jgi:hypothetical protein
MNGNGRFGWVLALAAVLFAVAVAMIAYNVGVADGVAAGAAPAAAVRRVQWGQHGGGFVWLLFFALFWMVAWGGCRRRYWYGGAWGPGPWARRDADLEAWHRHAHDQMKEKAPADDPGRRG